MGSVLDGSVAAVHRIEEREGDFYVNVPGATEFYAKGAQDVAKHVVEIDEVAKANGPWLGGKSARSKGGLTEAIECGPFLGIAQDLVSRIKILEPLVGRLIVGIAVRVALSGELAERRLDLRFIRMTRNVQHFVGARHDLSEVARLVDRAQSTPVWAAPSHGWFVARGIGKNRAKALYF